MPGHTAFLNMQASELSGGSEIYDTYEAFQTSQFRTQNTAAQLAS